MKRLLDEDPECLWDTVLYADVRNHILSFLDPLSRLLLRRTNKANFEWIPPADSFYILEYFYAYGTVNIMEKLCGPRIVKDGGHAASYAASTGNLDVLRWLYEKGFIITRFTLELAACYGQLSVMKWLKDIERLEWSSRTMQQAVAYGSIENLEWMLANGCKEPHTQMYTAIKYGHLDVLKWLHARGHELVSLDLNCAQDVSPPNLALVTWVDETLNKQYESYWESVYEPGVSVAIPDNDDDDI